MPKPKRQPIQVIVTKKLVDPPTYQLEFTARDYSTVSVNLYEYELAKAYLDSLQNQLETLHNVPDIPN
jgi:translation initiation factor 2 alpha subunit (eIF-2alpha)